MHIYTAKIQRATKYKCDAGFVIKIKPRKLLWCWNCNKRAWAQNMVVQTYYDGDRFYHVKCPKKKTGSKPEGK